MNLRVFSVLLLFGLMQPKLAWGVELFVELRGLDAALSKHVKSYLDIYREQESEDLSVARIQRHYKNAEAQIKTALQVYGYYDPVIHSSLKQDEQDWIARFDIDKGVPVIIKAVDVQVLGEGVDNPQLRARLDNFPIKPGDVAAHPNYDTARDELLRLANEQGYLDARMSKHELIIDLREHSASVALHLETGERYYFGPVQIHQDTMSEAFIERYIRFKPGEVYNPSRVLQLKRELVDSEYYQTVEVNPLKQQAVDRHVPIEVSLTARKPRSWSFGLGYATDTGARASAYHTRILGDEGHKTFSNLQISEKRNSLVLGYTIPLQDPVTEQLGIGISYVDETTETRESEITGTNLTYASNWRTWRRVISLSYERETYTIGDEPQTTKDILFPSIALTRVRFDDRIYPRHASRIYGEFRGANENLYSDTNFGQMRLGLKWIRGFGENNRLLLRGDFGATNVGDLDSLPASQRFYAGGDNSVRGYQYESLGPTNELGEVIGGKYLVVGSIEVDRRIFENWSAAVFYDVGNAVNSLGDELFAGAGMGLRWHSPVGPIRFDFAWALDNDQYKDRFRLHIVIGTDV